MFVHHDSTQDFQDFLDEAIKREQNVKQNTEYLVKSYAVSADNLYSKQLRSSPNLFSLSSLDANYTDELREKNKDVTNADKELKATEERIWALEDIKKGGSLAMKVSKH